MSELIGLGILGLAASLLIGLTRLRRRSAPRLRPIAGLSRLYRAFGLSVEDGSRLLISLGGASLLTRQAAAALSGLGLVREVSQKASASDRPPVAVSGEAALALLSQDSLEAGYRANGAGEYYLPETGRLAGLTPFSAAAATMSMFADERVTAAVLIGHFGPEAALLSEAAERMGAVVLGASSEPSTQAALYATASEALIGEELYAAPAYFGGRPSFIAGLVVEDVFRWLIVIGLVVAAALKILGLI